jgi:hypothetical protein
MYAEYRLDVKLELRDWIRSRFFEDHLSLHLDQGY